MKNHYTLASIKKIKWGILEENKPVSLCPVMQPGWGGVVKETGKILGKPQTNILCLHRGDSGLIFVDHKEWTALGQFALRKILKQPRWGVWLNRQIIRSSDELVRFTSKKVFFINLHKKTTLQLVNLYEEYLEKQCQVYNHSLVPVYLDLYKPHLTSYVIQYLDEQIRRFKYPGTAKECFTQLTVPQKASKVLEEEIALLHLAASFMKRRVPIIATKNSCTRTQREAIERHIKRYRHLGYNFEGPALPDSYFWKRLQEFVRSKPGPKQRVEEILQEKKQARRQEQRIIKQLKIDQRHRQVIELTKGFIFSKDYRKMALVRSYYEVEPLLRELGRRFGLSLRQTRNCLLGEIKLMLKNKSNQPKDLSKRMKGCLFVIINRQMPGQVFVDHYFTAMKKHLLKKEDFTEVNYFHGQSACLGKAQGMVKIINTSKDIYKMKLGDVMVSQMTNPELVPAMKKAAAIITDLGGITSHAAIVSRELGVPCVIGTKIATQVLRDGDKVEVDANSGEIRKV